MFLSGLMCCFSNLADPEVGSEKVNTGIERNNQIKPKWIQECLCSNTHTDLHIFTIQSEGFDAGVWCQIIYLSWQTVCVCVCVSSGIFPATGLAAFLLICFLTLAASPNCECSFFLPLSVYIYLYLSLMSTGNCLSLIIYILSSVLMPWHELS